MNAATATTFVPKKTGAGDFIWVGIDNRSYALIGVGTTSRVQVDSRRKMKVSKSASGKGWDLIIDGEVLDTYRLKIDAQWDGIEYITAP